MALVEIFRIVSNDARSSLILSYNDTANTFLAETLTTRGVRTTLTAPSSNIPTLYPIVAGAKAEYRFCEGSTLVEFEQTGTFPFAARVTTANAAVCTVNSSPDGIEVSLQVTDETALDAQDGTITVTALSLRPIVSYKIWNRADYAVAGAFGPPTRQSTTGVFTQLPPDFYVVQVATAGFSVVADATVNPFTLAGYGLFARASYESDVFRTPIRIDIKKKDYSGVVRTACADPATRTYKGTKTAFLTSYIYGLSLDFGLVANSLRDWSVLYTQDDREYLVEYFVGGEMKFRGYLLPEFLDQAYFDGKHVARFTATDGLGQLKDYPFVRANGERYTGVMSLQSVLEACLRKVNIFLPALNAIVWTPEYTVLPPDYSKNVLAQTAIDTAAFYSIYDNPTCEDVVHAVCVAFGGASLFQSGGNFIMLSAYNFLPGDTLDLKGSAAATTVPRFSRSGSREQLFAQADNVLVTLESGLSIEPGVQTISLTEKLYPIAGLVPNSNLQDASKWEQFAIPPSARMDNWRVAGWFGLAQVRPLAPSPVVDFRTRPGVKVNLPAQVDGMVFRAVRARESDAREMVAPCGILKREVRSPTPDPQEISLLVYLKFQMKSMRAPTRIRFYVRWGTFGTTGDWYLASDNTQWVKQKQYITYTFTDSEYGSDQEVSFTTPPLPQNDFPLPGFDENPLEIAVSEPYLVNPSDTFALQTASTQATGGLGRSGGIGPVEWVFTLKAAQLKPLPGGSELQVSRPRVFNNRGEFATPSVSVEQTLGTHHYGRNNELFYPFALRNADTGLAWTYWRDQNGDFYEFSQLGHRTLIKARQIPREVIRATLRGRFEFYQKLLLMQDNDLAYFCAEAVYEDNLDTITGIFVYSEGDFPGRLRRIHEQGTGMLTENSQNTRTFENYLYDEDFDTIF